MSSSSGQAFSGALDEATLAILPSAQVTYVHLLRHGEVEELTRRVVRGQMDVELSTQGSAHGRELARWFAQTEPRPDRVITSDLARCRVLADELGALVGRVARVDRRLREQSMGAWEGRTWEDITRAQPQAVTAYWDDYHRARPTGGESVADVDERVAQWWKQTLQEAAGERIVVVTHIGVIRVLLSRFLELPISQSLRFSPATASHTSVLVGNAGAVIQSIGERPWCYAVGEGAVS